MRGPVADWPKPEKGANPAALRKASARRARSREERLPGRCAACERETLRDAHLCSRCWAIVPTPFRQASSDAAYLLSFGNPVREEYGDVEPEQGWPLQLTLERRHRIALLACEIAARIFADGGGET